jgi:hypothetical protein
MFPFILNITKGAVFRQQFEWRDGDNPVNLTGWTALCHIRDRTTNDLIFALSTENGGVVLGGELGTVNLFLSAIDTGTFDPDQPNAVWDISLRDPNGEIYPPLIGGKVMFHNMVTAWPP